MTTVPTGLEAQVVAHLARMVGLPASPGRRTSEVVIGGGGVRVILGGAADLPSGVTATSLQDTGALRAVRSGGRAWGRLRTFHRALAWEGSGLAPIVVDEAGHALWCWRPEAEGGALLVGTDLAADLTLVRQGSPRAADHRPTEAMWGLAGERPNYLFADLVETDRPGERLADWWIWTLRDALCGLAGVQAAPVLPFDAPGAVIVTGDDDQADLESYAAQSKRLGRLPVTYFLHPLTKHTRETLDRFPHGGTVEWELHPDSLDSPDRYAANLHDQAAWFETVTGRRARLVRNHGFLNDGYWGHLPAWLAEGIVGSSNLPGLDGCVVNGSLLPARLAVGGDLTPHWSLLTTFGDGAFFIHDWSDEEALARLARFAGAMADSGVPGLVVMNLHPANQEKAAAMHEAAHRLVSDSGFIAWSLGQALAWFEARDAGVGLADPKCLSPNAPTRLPVVQPVEDVAVAGSTGWARAVDYCRTLLSRGRTHG